MGGALTGLAIAPRPQRKIAIENMLKLLGCDARAFVIHMQVYPAVVAEQVYLNAAACRRKADRVRLDILECNIDDTGAGPDERVFLQHSAQADIDRKSTRLNSSH